MDAGSMNRPMGMSGFPTCTTALGGLTPTDVGCGIRYVVGPGSHTILGAGVFTTMGDGSGALAWGGIGYLPPTGARPGFPGTMDLTTTAGALRAIMAIPE